jgi:hypothetical protein
VAFALVDVLAIFYRLRVIRYYQRRRRLGGAYAWTRPSGTRLLVSVLSVDPDAAARFDYENVERIVPESDSGEARRGAAERAQGEVLAFVEPDARPSGNWLSATVPFFARAGVDAAVTPILAPHQGTRLERAAAAISESRIGGGSLHFRFTPGNIRLVGDFPARSFLVRRTALLALGARTPPEEVVLELAASGADAVYLPEASLTLTPPPLFRPYVSRVVSYGRARGALVRRRGWRAVRPSTLAALAFLFFATAGWLVLLAGGAGLDAWIAVWALYGALVVASAGVAALRFRDLAILPLAAVGTIATHAAYAVSFAGGLLRRR